MSWYTLESKILGVVGKYIPNPFLHPVLHFTAGVLVSLPFAFFGVTFLPFAVSTTVGVAKEVMDHYSGKGQVSALQGVSTAFGGLVVTLVVWVLK